MASLFNLSLQHIQCFSLVHRQEISWVPFRQAGDSGPKFKCTFPNQQQEQATLKKDGVSLSVQLNCRERDCSPGRADVLHYKRGKESI